MSGGWWGLKWIINSSPPLAGGGKVGMGGLFEATRLLPLGPLIAKQAAHLIRKLNDPNPLQYPGT